MIKYIAGKTSCSLRVVLILVLIAVLLMFGEEIHDLRWASKERRYYSNAPEFVMVTGKLKECHWYNWNNSNEQDIGKRENADSYWFLFDFEEYGNPYSFSSSYSTFRLDHDSLKIARRSGLDEKLEIGKEITFMCDPNASRQFHLAYWYEQPIVALWIDGEELLSFEDGYAALMRSFDQRWQNRIKAIRLYDGIEPQRTDADTGRELRVRCGVAGQADELRQRDDGVHADVRRQREPAELPERLRVHVEPGASAGGGEQERPCGEL
jgi:hypothetical protein